jgi:hypothetical protein
MGWCKKKVMRMKKENGIKNYHQLQWVQKVATLAATSSRKIKIKG